MKCFVLFTEFFLKNKVTGTCVDVSGAPGVNALANVHTWACELISGTSDQIWSMDDGGRLMSRPSAPDMCLDVSDNDNIQIDNCDNNPDQVWEFEYDVTGQCFLIRNNHTDKCLTLSIPNDSTNGVNLILSTCDRNPESDDWWEKLRLSPGE